MLRQVGRLPTLAVTNSANRCVIDAIEPAERSLRFRGLADGRYLALRQLCRPAALTASDVVPSLRHHIAAVFRPGANEQMSRIATSPTVTCVADTQIPGQRCASRGYGRRQRSAYVWLRLGSEVQIAWSVPGQAMPSPTLTKVQEGPTIPHDFDSRRAPETGQGLREGGEGQEGIPGGEGARGPLGEEPPPLEPEGERIDEYQACPSLRPAQ
jgi:hypothetical protein